LLLRSVPHIETKNIGGNQFLVSAMSAHALLCWVWPLVRMAQIELGGCSREIAVASGCFVQCIVQGLQTKQLPTIETMG
jgi:hypothetical protein